MKNFATDSLILMNVIATNARMLMFDLLLRLCLRGNIFSISEYVAKKVSNQ